MSISVARKKRTALYASIAGLMFFVAALYALSARDPDGVAVRTGMILVTLGAAMWLPWQALLPAAIAVWLGPNIGRSSVEAYDLFNLNMMLELPGLLGVAAMSTVARMSIRDLEQESILLGMSSDSVGMDPVTGVFEESQLRSSLEVELSRSRRFGRTFALVLVGIDEMRQRFDYRDEEVWQASFAATADLLRRTRANVDRVYRYGPAGFALILPESGPKDVNGLVRRLRRLARGGKPQEGEPGGPLPAHYGATFFPTCATTVDDLIRRAEIALRISDNNASRVQLDGAEAPEMPPVETLRQSQPEAASPIESMTSQASQDEAPATPALRLVESDARHAQMAREEAIGEPVAQQDAEAVISSEAETSAELETPRPLFAEVDRPTDEAEVDAEPKPARLDEEASAMLAVEPAVAEQETAAQPEEPETVFAAFGEPAAAPVEPEPLWATEGLAAMQEFDPIVANEEPLREAGTPEPASLYAVEEANVDADEALGYSEADEPSPLEVFAYRAPEPAVDVYNNNWQAEAPLSVIRRPQPAPRLVALDGGASEQHPPVDMLNDALKQLDGTLELIRSLKQRSA